MPPQLAATFRADLNALRAELGSIPPDWADSPWRDGGWTRKQIIGHLLDSATNNRQRFVRAGLDGHYEGPRYSQDGWVAMHGYADQPWGTLLLWWDVEHAILAEIVDRIPESRLEAECRMGNEDPVTLRFLIEDYLVHQHWHLDQMTGKTKAK